MRAVLVTGGLGFVGSHLVDALLAKGCRVTIVDSLASNAVPPEMFQDRCRVILGKIEEVHENLLSDVERFEEVYHLACQVGPAGVLQFAGDMFYSVGRTTDACMQLALRHGARLLSASTSEVYGRSGKLAEDLGCIVGPQYTVRLEYAAAKLTSEIALLNKARVSDLKVNVVRPFNISGPRQLPDGGFVLPRFVLAALTGAPLTVFEDGKQIRAFTDVRDIVSGLMAMMRCKETGLVLNLGNPKNEISILDLAKLVKKVAKSDSEIQHVDPKVLFGPLYEEGIERVPNVEKALKSLDWVPSFTIEQTIQDTLEYFRARPDLVEAFERSCAQTV